VDLVLLHIGLIARFLLGLDVLALITPLGGAKREAEEWWGQTERRQRHR
jgi:hypothetical protein